MRLALYQPDIAPNVGNILRTGACLDVPIDIIEPCGFPFSDRALKRAGMDYAQLAEVRRHRDWTAFDAWRRKCEFRLLLLTTHGQTPYTAVRFRADDILLLGQEGAGVPNDIHDIADERVVIPQLPGTRSLNIAVAGAIVLSEALRQTGLFPDKNSRETEYHD